MKNNHLTSQDFQKSDAVEKIYNYDLMKGAKSAHKYIRIENGRYIYNDSRKGQGIKIYDTKNMSAKDHKKAADFHAIKYEDHGGPKGDIKLQMYHGELHRVHLNLAEKKESKGQGYSDEDAEKEGQNADELADEMEKNKELVHHLAYMDDPDFVPNDRKDYEKITNSKVRKKLLDAYDSRNKNFDKLHEARKKKYE